jgi:hypothetical protein
MMMELHIQTIGPGDSMFQGPEDGHSMFLRNAGIYLQVHTASQSRTTTEKWMKILEETLL